jgi:hypothetical protein
MVEIALEDFLASAEFTPQPSNRLEAIFPVIKRGARSR